MRCMVFLYAVSVGRRRRQWKRKRIEMWLRFGCLEEMTRRSCQTVIVNTKRRSMPTQ